MSKKADANPGGAPAAEQSGAARPLPQDEEGSYRIALAQSESAQSFSGERFVPGVSGEMELEHLHRYLFAAHLAAGAEVVDIACGEGYGSYMLAQRARSVVGIDIDRHTVAQARERYERPNLSFKEGTCAALPLPPASADMVISFETIEHIRAQEEFIAEVRRVLRPGGTLVLSSPERELYNSYRREPNQFHLKELSRDELDALLKKYFAHVQLGVQRTIFGSSISGKRFNRPCLVMAHQSGEAVRVEELPACPYMIAVCSDREVPQLPSSLFEGSVAPYLVSALQGGLAEREKDIIALRRSLAEKIEEAARARPQIEVEKELRDRLTAQEQLIAEKESVLDDLSTKLAREQMVSREAERRVVQFQNRSVELQEEVRKLEARCATHAQAGLAAEASAAKPADAAAEYVRRAWRLGRELLLQAGPACSGKWRAGLPALKRLPWPLSRLGWGREYDAVKNSRLFDGRFYLEQNADVAAKRIDPVWHYLEFGGKEHRAPSPMFDGRAYLDRNADVAAHGMNPLVHYLLYGEREKRSAVPWFDYEFYLSWNPEGGDNPQGVFNDYLQNWYPAPRQSFGDGEMPQLVEAINAHVLRSPALRGEAGEAPVVSVIIPVYGQLRITLKCLLALVSEGARVPFEVIVVDDCSTDQTPEILPCLSHIRYVRRANNGGFIAACNGGAEIARGEYLVFLNNDTCVLPGWLDELYDTFTLRPNAGLVGSQLLYPDGRLQEAGCIIWRDGSGWNYGRGGERNRPEFNYLRAVDYCSGAAIMVRRALLSEFGGFDTHYSPAYAEDCDLAFKVRKAGYEVLYQPLSRVVHFEGVSSGTDLTRGVKAYQVQNCRKFQERWAKETAAHRPAGEAPHLERDRGIRRRVLVIDASTPTPDSDAGSVVLFHTLRILQDLGYGVTFIPSDNLLHAGRYTADLQRRGVECLYFPYIKSVDEYLQQRGKDLDLVILYRCPIAARHIDAVRRLAPQAKVLFNTVDLHFLREQRQAELAKSDALLRQAKEREEQELGIMRKADATILLNDREVELIARLAPEVKTYMLPLIQDVPGCRTPFAERRDIVFVGGFNHPPNLDAVKFFCTEIFPHVRLRLPQVRFVVVGSNVPAQVQEFAGEGVEIRGFVPDLADVFERYRISVAPLRIGAGMKGKIVASLSYGVPCVATSIGAEGMRLTHGEHVLIADDPAAFAEAVCAVYQDAAQWQALSHAGVLFARGHFSPEAVGGKIAAMLDELGLRGGK